MKNWWLARLPESDVRDALWSWSSWPDFLSGRQSSFRLWGNMRYPSYLFCKILWLRHCMPTLLAGKLKSSGLAFIFGVVARLCFNGGAGEVGCRITDLDPPTDGSCRPTVQPRFFCIHGIRWPAVCCKSSFVGSDSWLHQCLWALWVFKRGQNR